MYAKRLGVDRNDIEAPRRYRRAAERGHPAAQYNLGLFHATGRGIAPDVMLAVAWLSMAEENGAQPTGLLGTLRGNLSAADLKDAEKLVDDVRQQCRLD